MAAKPTNLMKNEQFSQSGWPYLSSTEDGHSSPDLQPLSMSRATTPPKSQHTEHTSRTSSPSHTRELSTSELSVTRKPLPPTASSLQTLPGQTSAEEPLLSSSKSKHQIVSTRGSNWNYEIGALVISLGSLVTVLALLVYTAGRRLDQWNGSISLNALVSALGAVSRTSLGFVISSCLGQAKWNWFRRRPDNLITFDRFDDASRGPWGSLWLIFRLRTYHWVTVGALATIILMGLEPLLQAVISFSGQMDASTSPVEPQIGRSVVLDVGSYSTDASSPLFQIQMEPSNLTMTFAPYVSIPDLGMLSSFNNGFYNSSHSIKQTTSYSCPTANCTWPRFTSSGVCSACSDVTSYLRRYKQEGQDLATLRYSVESVYGNFTINSLPRLNLTNLSDINLQNGDDVILFSRTARMAATAITDPQLTLSFQHLNTAITIVQVLKASTSSESGNLTWDETPVSATECALYFCVNVYESVVEKGLFSERIISSWAERDPTSYHLDGDDGIHHEGDFATYEKWNNFSLYSWPQDFPRTDLELFIPKEDARHYDLPNNMTLRFKLTQNTVGSTVRFVNDDLLSRQMTWPFGQNTDLKPVIQALYESDDLSATFDNVAWTVTNWMRDVSNVTHAGTGQDWVIHIYVDWYYMILPLLTITLGLVFSVWSIFETCRLRLDPWKTDMIAVLTRSVDSEIRAQLRHADRHGYLEKAAKSMTVTFDDTGCGLELRKP
ncbi:hypothetical protein GGR54DRAFT_596471 [Hypoxylon sp. NC1633]|nr:hypothetical protein GGR54DRAFT_596471 [Hypoxylon sp. NC1633]